MMRLEKLTDTYLDHEVRIRIQEQNAIELKQSIRDIHNMFKWLFGTMVVAVIIPIGLHYFNLSLG